MGKAYILKVLSDGTKISVKDVQKVLLAMLKDIDAICKKYEIPYFLMGGSALGAIRHNGFIPWDDDVDIAMKYEDYVRFVEVLKKEMPNDTYSFLCFETQKEYNVCIPTMKILKKGTHIKEANIFLKNKCKDGDGLFIDVFVVDSICEKKWIDFLYRLLTYPWMLLIVFIENVGFNPFLLKKGFVKYARKYSEKYKDSTLMGLDLCWTFAGLIKPIVYKKEDVYPLKEHLFEDALFMIPKNIHAFLNASIGVNHMCLPPLHKRRSKHIIDIDMGGK